MTSIVKGCSMRSRYSRPGKTNEALINGLMLLIGIGVMAVVTIKLWPEEKPPQRETLEEAGNVAIRVGEGPDGQMPVRPTSNGSGGMFNNDTAVVEVEEDGNAPIWTNIAGAGSDEDAVLDANAADPLDLPAVGDGDEANADVDATSADTGEGGGDGDTARVVLGPALEIVPRGEYPALPAVLGLEGFKTEHYEIYSQLSDEATYDLAMRMESLYDYYAEQFSDVHSPINWPLLIFFFNNREDFVAAGGHEFMPGQFMGGYGDDVGARLMVKFNEGDITSFISSCGLTYHENFHQFLALEISQGGNASRQWPLWLNESYATTFNNIIWTGDGWVDGIIQASYGESAGDSIDSFLSIRSLLTIDGAKWHELTNEGQVWPVYMQGMSLIHFLNEYDGGEYRDLLAEYVEECSTGEDTGVSERKIIRLAGTFENWAEDHMSYRITSGKYYEVFAAMAASHLARVHARGQKFPSAESFIATARAGRLDLAAKGDDQWLPDSLRQEMLYYYNLLAADTSDPMAFEIDYSDGLPVVTISREGVGLELTASFTLDDNNKVESVDVEWIKCLSLDFNEAERLKLRRSRVNIADELNGD